MEASTENGAHKGTVFKLTNEKSLTDISLDLVLDDVSFAYGSGKECVPVLHDVTIDIHGAQLVSIIGPNGVGKSTLIHCINKILRPSSGLVYIGDADVSDIGIKDLAKFVGYVPCTSGDSFPLSVTDTVLMGRHPHSHWGSLDDDLRIVYDTLKLLGIEDLADRSFNELSAGQHQKVMLARGLAQEPKILLLDEPTSNLDIRYQLEITRILRNLSHDKGIIVVMISHDLNIAAKYSDNIIMMKNGGIHAVGTPQDVITEENISTVYGIGCRVIKDRDRPHVILIDNEDTGEGYDGDYYVVNTTKYSKVIKKDGSEQ
jgi:iron complex transport system ATP-binding protein